MAFPHAAPAVDRHKGAGLPEGIIAALEREAAHLTRRDGRRHNVRWGDDLPSIEDVTRDGECCGLIITAIVLT